MEEREREELYAAGVAAQADIEPPTLLDLADALAAAVDMEEQAIVLLQDESTPGHRKNLEDMRRAKRLALVAYRTAREGGA